MSEQIQQQALEEALSALMDNEASELEIMRLLKACDGQDELKSTWARYQIASAALRSDLPTLASADFASRISVAIADEETYSAAGLELKSAQESLDQSASISAPMPWWQQLGRVAVAASVAGALVVGVQQYQGLNNQALVADSAPAASAQPNQVTPADLPSGINAPALSARTVAVQSGYETRPQETRRVLFVPRQEATPVYNDEVSTYVNQLIEEHSGNAAANSGQGMLPFTRVILTDDE